MSSPPGQHVCVEAAPQAGPASGVLHGTALHASITNELREQRVPPPLRRRAVSSLHRVGLRDELLELQLQHGAVVQPRLREAYAKLVLQRGLDLGGGQVDERPLQQEVRAFCEGWCAGRAG